MDKSLMFYWILWMVAVSETHAGKILKPLKTSVVMIENVFRNQ